MSGAGLEPATFWVPDGESRGGVPFLLDTPLIVGYHLSYPYLASLTPTLCVIGQACPPTAGSSPVSRSNCDEAEVGPGPDPFLAVFDCRASHPNAEDHRPPAACA